MTDPEIALERLAVRWRGARVADIAWVRRGEAPLSLAVASLEHPQRHRLDAFDRRERVEEYALSRWLLARLGAADDAPCSISHSRRHVAVAVGRDATVGVDVEDRLPRAVDDVGQRLGWPRGVDALQCWTLWEAWRKLDGGSVLDLPGPVYRRALTQTEEISLQPVFVDGVLWRSLRLPGAWISLAARPG